MLSSKSFLSLFFSRNNKHVVLFGPGVVGKATAEVFGIKTLIDYKDEFGFVYSLRESPNESVYDAKEIWIAVPTPSSPDGTCDISEVEKVIKFCAVGNRNKKALYVIRSTVTPGTAEKLSKKYQVAIISFPEFLSENSALQDVQDPWFVVIGMPLNDQTGRVNAFLEKYSWYYHDKPTMLVDNNTAELVKYSVNSLFATMVVFGNQIYDVAQKINADYHFIKLALSYLPWKKQHHLSVFHKGYRGYGGRCLPKDTLALATTFNVELLKNVHRINEQIQRDNPGPQQARNNPKSVKVLVKSGLPARKPRNHRR